MSKFDTCLTSLNLRDSVPVDIIKSTAADYLRDGMSASAAMLRAVEDQLEVARIEERGIIEAVRDQYERRGGKKRVAPAAPADKPVAAAPKPAAVEEPPAPILRDITQGPTATPEFRKWFGESKVMDKDGNPLKVYHGSPDLRFMGEDGIFKSQKEKLGFGREEAAHWFAASAATAKSYADPRRAFDYQNAEEGVIPAYLKMENPLIVDGKGQKWRDAQKSGKTTDVIREAREGGHDGVIIRNVRDNYQTGVVRGESATDTYVVFESKQIKSADRNNGNFDPDNPSVLQDLSDQRTIEVDGKRRPIKNSRGQLVAPDFDGQVAFWKFYGDGPVDTRGRPVVLYHGTDNEIDAFDVDRDRTGDDGYFGQGIYLTDATGQAEEYGSKIMPLYAAIQKPYPMDFLDEAGTARALLELEGFTPEQRQRLQEQAELYANEEGDGMLHNMLGAVFHPYKVARGDFSMTYGAELTTILQQNGYDGVAVANAQGEEGWTEYVAFKAEQVKSAAGDNDKFDPADPVITRDLMELMRGYMEEAEVPKRVATVAKLKAARRRLDAGEITDADYRLKIDGIISALDERNAARALPKERERGPEWVTERLMRARRTGELDRASVDFALWALNKNPAMAEDLGISLRGQKDGGTAGTYDPVSRVVTLFKGAENSGTVVHEILHHTERMMPLDVQQQIVKAWRKAFARAHMDANDKVRAALNDMLVMASDSKAAERVIKAFRERVLDYDTHYQLANASEYWAVNATRIMSERHAAGSWVAKARQWLRELMLKMRGWLGLPSDAAVLKGLSAVLDGSGERMSPKMLVEQGALRDIDDSYRDEHRAPGRDGGAPLSDLTGDGNIYPDDIYSANGPRYYGTGATYDAAAFRLAKMARNNPDFDVMVYRAVPKDVDAEINPGDWVAITRQYAEDHGESRFDGEYKILSKMVKAGDIFTNGDSIQEWGYDPEETTLRDISRPLPTTTWAEPSMTMQDTIIHTLQDKHIDMKRVVAAVRAQVGELEDKWNPYLQEELFHGRAATGFKNFLNDELRPLLDDMKMRGVSMDELQEYLHMRHAEEANEQIASIDPDMPDGGSGVDTQDARDYLAALPPAKARAYAALAARVDAIIKGTQRQLVEYGLEKQSTIDTWNATYSHYVPLMRENMDSPMQGNGTGAGFSIRGSSSKRRTGSKRAVIDILANVAMARERAIVRGEKNRLDLALYGLALQAPNPSFWKPVNPQKNPQALVDELVNMGLPAAAAQAIVDEPKQKTIDPNTGMVVYRTNPLLRSAPNVIAVRVGGEDRFIFFNEKSERALRLAMTLKNLGTDQVGRFLSTAGYITRAFAAINTQYNPIFGIKNMIRDVGEGAVNLSATPLAGQQGEFMKESARLLAHAARHGFRLERLTGNDAALWQEFQEEGGITGFRAMFSDSADRARELAREMNPDAWMESKVGKYFTAGGTLKVPYSVARKAMAPVFDWLSDYNEALENCTRLSIYKLAKANGMTKQQAASMAKSTTVNFNRKGAIGSQVGSLYAFFNAATQGIARGVTTLSSPAGKKIIAGGLLLGVLQAMMMAAAGFDDEEPPEFIKAKNFIIPFGWITGKKDYLSIPMPLGFSFLPTIGRVGTEFALGGGKKVGKHVMEILGALADTFNPIGSSTVLQTMLPTAADPIAALAENKDYTGKRIYREDMSALHPTPGFTRTKDTASGFSKGFAEFINAASGGNDYRPGMASPTPDQIDYLLGQLTGGVGRELLKTQQSVSAAVSGEDLPAHKIPLVGVFYGNAEEKSAVSNKFYSNLKELNVLGDELEGRMKDRANPKEFLAEHPEAKLARYGAAVERDLSALRKRKRVFMERGEKAKVEEIEARMRTLMGKFNERVEKSRAATEAAQ